MGSYEENYLAKRPQHLCHMCGKCCRMSTTSTPYEELKKLAAEGHQGAIDFLSIFVPYKSIEEARKVEPEVVENVIQRHKEDGKYNKANLTFYGCKYLGKDNLCTRYESRLDLCKHCPSTPWSIVPPGCGFEGWLFWQREEIKKKIRLEKEELLDLKILRLKTTNEEVLKKITLVEHKIQKSIDLYKKYGSENW